MHLECIIYTVQKIESEPRTTRHKPFAIACGCAWASSLRDSSLAENSIIAMIMITITMMMMVMIIVTILVLLFTMHFCLLLLCFYHCYYH